MAESILRVAQVEIPKDPNQVIEKACRIMTEKGDLVMAHALRTGKSCANFEKEDWEKITQIPGGKESIYKNEDAHYFLERVGLRL